MSPKKAYAALASKKNQVKDFLVERWEMPPEEQVWLGRKLRAGVYYVPIAPFTLLVPYCASVVRQTADYYIPLKVAELSELWRGIRETFFGVSAIFSKSERRYGIDFQDALVKKGELRKTHVVRHSLAQGYDVYFGYRLLRPYMKSWFHIKIPFTNTELDFLPISWAISVAHDISYNLIVPLLPRNEPRDTGARITEAVRGAKLDFNCPGWEETASVWYKLRETWRKEQPVEDPNGLREIVYGSLSRIKEDLIGQESNLEKKVLAVPKGLWGIPGGICDATIYMLAEHKFYRTAPAPVETFKTKFDAARTSITRKQHPHPWHKSKKVFDYVKRKASKLHKHIHN